MFGKSAEQRGYNAYQNGQPRPTNPREAQGYDAAKQRDQQNNK